MNGRREAGVMNGNSRKRFIVLIVGLIILSLGIALFKVSAMGNDSHTAMVMAIGDKIGIKFSFVLLVANTIWFIGEIIFGRCYIGIGTFANWFGVGMIASFWIDWIHECFIIPEGFVGKLFVMLVGMLVLSLGVSMYQTSDLGIAPYDVLSIIMSEKLPISYFWCRIITDSVCTLIAFSFGGLIGLGTVICVLGLGPFIAFFNKHISEKLVGTDKDCL